MSTTKGEIYAHSMLVPTFDRPLIGNICVYPTQTELQPLLQCLREQRIEKVVSIGCGEAWLEGLLEREGLQVTAVDLDYLRSGAEYLRVRCYCQSGIVRINAHQIYDIDDPADSALLFCFGRKNVHFHKYLERYRQCRIVVVIGDRKGSGVASPSADELLGNPDWSLMSCTPVRAVMPAEMAVYERV